MQTLLSEFVHPSGEYSPFPFWFLNGDLREEKIEKQLKDFASKGILGVVLHPRIGIPRTLPYLSDAFMEKIAFAAKCAKTLGMRVILYDEGMYPSGSAHGMVVRENPNYAAKGIYLAEAGSPLLEGDSVLIRLAVRKTGADAYETARALQEGEAAFPGETVMNVIAGFTRGTIRGVHEGEDDGEKDAPPAADLLNAEAMRAFIRLTHERYYEYLKDDFGKTVIAFFTDEPGPTGRNARKGMLPWTDGFERDAEAQGFAKEDYAALFMTCGGREKELRARYDRLVNARLVKTYYRPLAEWCASRGIALAGHPHSSQDSKMLTEFQIPGQDIVWRWVAPENDLGISGEHSAQAKCASDIARHTGAVRNLNECFGCCGPNGEMWAFNVWDMKWYLNWLFARGCNLIVPHAFFYELNTPVQADRPPDVGPNNIWWDEYERIALYIRRMCMLNTGGVNRARVAVLATGDRMPVDEVRRLYERQVEFNYLTDEHFVREASVTEGKIVIRSQAYEALLIDPALNYGYNALEAAKRAQALGVKVFYGYTDKLDAYRTVRLSGKKQNIRASLVERKGSEILILANEGDTDYSGRAALPFEGAIAVLNPWTGSMRRAYAPGGEMALKIGAREIIVLAKTEGVSELPAYENAPAVARSIPLDSRWTMTLPSGKTVSGLRDWQEIDEIRVYSGTIVYRAEISFKNAPARALLALGEVREKVKVTVNGKALETLIAPPYACDLSGYLQRGKNEILAECTNCLVGKYENKPWKSGIFGKTFIKVLQSDGGEE